MLIELLRSVALIPGYIDSNNFSIFDATELNPSKGDILWL